MPADLSRAHQWRYTTCSWSGLTSADPPLTREQVCRFCGERATTDLRAFPEEVLDAPCPAHPCREREHTFQDGRCVGCRMPERAEIVIPIER